MKNSKTRNNLDGLIKLPKDFYQLLEDSDRIWVGLEDHYVYAWTRLWQNTNFINNESREYMTADFMENGSDESVEVNYDENPIFLEKGSKTFQSIKNRCWRMIEYYQGLYDECDDLYNGIVNEDEEL